MDRHGGAAFLLEYLMVILFFALASAVTVRIFAVSYLRNDLANRKKECLAYVNGYIENGTYAEESFTLDEDFAVSADGIYQVEVKDTEDPYPHYVMDIYYGRELLISVPFYGGRS